MCKQSKGHNCNADINVPPHKYTFVVSETRASEIPPHKHTFVVSETRASEIDLQSVVYLQACFNIYIKTKSFTYTIVNIILNGVYILEV